MAKNNTGRGGADFAASTSPVTSDELDEIDETSLSTEPATLTSADDDMIDSAAGEPLVSSSGYEIDTPSDLNEVRGGGAPVPPSQFGETNTFATSAFSTAPATNGTEFGTGSTPDLKTQASQAVDQAKQGASEAVGQAKQAASQAFDQAKDQVKSQLESQKERAATTLDSLTNALRQTGENLQSADTPLPLGDYAQSFAGQIDRFTGYLRDKDIDQISHEVEDYARRNPVLFVGGAFLLGVAVARFLKSGSSTTYSYSGSNFSTASRSTSNALFQNTPTATGGPLVPVEGTARGELHSRTDVGTSRFEEDALPDNRPLTAHNYVPGIGVSDTGNTTLPND